MACSPAAAARGPSAARRSMTAAWGLRGVANRRPCSGLLVARRGMKACTGPSGRGLGLGCLECRGGPPEAPQADSSPWTPVERHPGSQGANVFVR